MRTIVTDCYIALLVPVAVLCIPYYVELRSYTII